LTFNKTGLVSVGGGTYDFYSNGNTNTRSPGTPEVWDLNLLVGTLKEAVQNNVHINVIDSSITAAFEPALGGTPISLQQVEALATSTYGVQVVGLNWTQTVTVPSPSPYKDKSGNSLVGTFPDPPKVSYQQPYAGGPADGYPFYYDSQQLSEAIQVGGYLLAYNDDPADPCLYGERAKVAVGKPQKKGMN
jgi:hypothetical protein